jgi:hypothetical protein
VAIFVWVFPIVILCPIVEAEALLPTVNANQVPDVPLAVAHQLKLPPPTVQLLSAERSYAVPLIVSVRDVGTKEVVTTESGFAGVPSQVRVASVVTEVSPFDTLPVCVLLVPESFSTEIRLQLFVGQPTYLIIIFPTNTNSETNELLSQ